MPLRPPLEVNAHTRGSCTSHFHDGTNPTCFSHSVALATAGHRRRWQPAWHAFSSQWCQCIACLTNEVTRHKRGAVPPQWCVHMSRVTVETLPTDAWAVICSGVNTTTVRAAAAASAVAATMSQPRPSSPGRQAKAQPRARRRRPRPDVLDDEIEEEPQPAKKKPRRRRDPNRPQVTLLALAEQGTSAGH